MFKKTILAAAASLAIAGGVLGASAGSAAADVVVRIGDGHHYGPHHQRYCKPIFKKVWVKRNHHWVKKWVKVGEDCGWRRW